MAGGFESPLEERNQLTEEKVRKLPKYKDSQGCTLNSVYPVALPFFDEVEENEKAPCIWSAEEADEEYDPEK